MLKRKLLFIYAIILLLLTFICFGVWFNTLDTHGKAVAPVISTNGIYVSGNILMNAKQPFRLIGVSRSGTEYRCLAQKDFFDGPSDAASVQAMVAWHINTVRVPLNEDCWLGINDMPANASAKSYRQAISDYVRLLNSFHLAVILDLHWNAPADILASEQQIMPDLDHAPAFWSSVASTFKGNPTVIFDLYNEPHPQNWDCWKNGSSSANTLPCSDVNFAVAGMQSLVNAVRNAHAANLIILGGINWSNDLTGWLSNRPTDPSNNLAVSVHLYNTTYCNSASCWNEDIAPVAAKVPIIAGELGEYDCAHTFIDKVMNWLDQHHISYLGWAWNTYDCGKFPSLISNYNGTPTSFGQGFKNHLTTLSTSSQGAVLP